MSPSPTEDGLYFLHVLKSGGSTVGRYLEAGFRPDDVCPARNWSDLLRLPRERIPQYRLFRGHFGSMLLDVLPRRPAVVTMVRDPVKRAVSHWRYVQRRKNHWLQAGPDLETFIRTVTPNTQVRHLGVDTAPAALIDRMRACRTPAQVWRTFDDWTAAQPDLLDRATDRLENCLAFGLVERFDQSVQLLAGRLGWAPPNGVATLNAAPPWQLPYEPSAGEIAAVLEADALDAELYARARRLFDRQWASAQAASLTATSAYARRLAKEARPLADEFSLDLREPFAGTGWLPPEETERGCVRWMAGTGNASIDLPLLLAEGAAIEIVCVGVAAARQARSWGLEVNGAPVELSATPIASGLLFRGTIPEGADASLGFTRLVFRVHETGGVNATGPHAYDSLELGIAVSQVRMVPRERSRDCIASPLPPAWVGAAAENLVAVRTYSTKKPARQQANTRVPSPAVGTGGTPAVNGARPAHGRDLRDELTAASGIEGGLERHRWPASRIPLRDTIAQFVRREAKLREPLPFETLHRRLGPGLQRPVGDLPPLVSLRQAGTATLNAYHRLVSHLASEILGYDLVFEADPFLRLHFPLPMPDCWRTQDGTVVSHHTDTFFGEPLRGINCWVPLTSSVGTATLQYLEFERSTRLLDRFVDDTGLNLQSWRRGTTDGHIPTVRRAFFAWLTADVRRLRQLLDDCLPLELDYGELALFDARLVHATAENREHATRVSLDFRVLPLDLYERIEANGPPRPVQGKRLVRGGWYDGRTAFEL